MIITVIIVVIIIAWVAYEVKTAPLMEDEFENINPDNQEDNK